MGHPRLVHPERMDWVDVRGSACREEAGDGGHDKQYECCSAECDGIAGCHAIQHSLAESQERESSDAADQYAGSGHGEPFRHDHAQNSRALGAESHSDSDLLCALGGEVRDHAINAGHRENERNCRERAN